MAYTSNVETMAYTSKTLIFQHIFLKAFLAEITQLQTRTLIPWNLARLHTQLCGSRGGPLPHQPEH